MLIPGLYLPAGEGSTLRSVCRAGALIKWEGVGTPATLSFLEVQGW